MKNAEKAQDQIVFKEKYDSLIKRLDPLQERLKIIESEKQQRIVKKSKMFQFIFDLKRFGEQKSVSDLKESNKTIKNFDESL